MIDRLVFNDYYQGPQRTPIQVERHEKHDWIVWNWRTASWDMQPSKLTDHGERSDGEK